MNARILVVDDEIKVRLNYRITLETEGFEIFELQNFGSSSEPFNLGGT